MYENANWDLISEMFFNISNAKVLCYVEEITDKPVVYAETCLLLFSFP